MTKTINENSFIQNQKQNRTDSTVSWFTSNNRTKLRHHILISEAYSGISNEGEGLKCFLLLFILCDISCYYKISQMNLSEA